MATDNNTDVQETTGWRPEPGDVLDGTVAELQKGWSDYTNSFYPIVTIRKEDGELVNVHCFHYTLFRRLTEIQPKIGDHLVITYKGKRKTKDEKRTVAIYSIDAPDYVQDTRSFWQGIGADSPNRDRVQQSKRQQTDIPVDENDFVQGELNPDDDIPF